MPSPFTLTDMSIPEGSEYHRLLERCPDVELRRFEEGEYIFREGDASEEAFLLIEGHVAVEVRSRRRIDGRHGEPLTHLHGETANPLYVGELAYLGEPLRMTSVRCEDTCQTLVLHPEHMGIIVAEFPLLTRMLCQQFTGHLRKALMLLKGYHLQHSLGSEPVELIAGTVLFEAGEPADALYRLISGQLVRETEEGEKLLSTGTLHQGLVDPAPYLRQGVYESRVRAKSDATLLRIPRESMEAVVRQHPDLILDLYRRAADSNCAAAVEDGTLEAALS